MSSQLSTVRQTVNGPIEGVEEKSIMGQKYYSFKGVPFAEPPITGYDRYTGEKCDRRLKAPEPLKRKWTENFKADKFADACLSFTKTLPEPKNASEDCLYLNIYVPADGAEKKTVIVWIHGGLYLGGDGSDTLFGPDLLISEDVVVVVLQYRLGLFGFLKLDVDGIDGNMGLKDQQLALKWVNENIASFSGDPESVLLSGQSVGGTTTQLHLINEESRKYFKRAFLTSGAAFEYYGITEKYVNHLARMQKCLNIYDINELLKYLKEASSAELNKCGRLDVLPTTVRPPWIATIESPQTVGAFMTKTPEQMYAAGKVPPIDIMLSFNDKEYTIYTKVLKISEPILKCDVHESKLKLPFDGFKENIYPNEYKNALKKLQNDYYSNVKNVKSIKLANIALLSDLNINYNVLKGAMYQIIANNNNADKYSNKNTFLYRFSVSKDLNVLKLLKNIKFYGAGHLDDICYYFLCHVFDDKKTYEKHLQRKDNTYHQIMRMVKMITNFAKTGNPSIEGDTPFRSCTSPSKIYCHEISNNLSASITTDILEQTHYSTWWEIESSYRNCLT